MFEHLRRLATTGAAYTASSVLSKLIAVFLLPIYTAYLTPADYGSAEIMIAWLIAISIVVRFGIIEALLRFYYLESERPAEVVRTGFAALFWTTSAAALIALPFAGQNSDLLLERSQKFWTMIARARAGKAVSLSCARRQLEARRRTARRRPKTS